MMARSISQKLIRKRMISLMPKMLSTMQNGSAILKLNKSNASMMENKKILMT